VLSPGKIGSFAADEAILLACALSAVAVVNVLLVRRAFAPLRDLIAFTATVDPARPGQRVPVSRVDSEAGELALRFNEMLERLELERRESTRRALAAQEGERLRVAQELHDEVGQKLTAVLLQLARASRRAPEPLREELAEVQEMVREGLEDTRRIAIELRPEALDDFGLARALAVLADRLREQTGLHVERRLDPHLPQLGPEAELVLYRIAQEALTNVVRHARADRAELLLCSEDGGVCLLVRDRGAGRPPGRPEGTGIRGMRERAALIGGVLSVSDGPDGGTVVQLELAPQGTSR
jgi:two-component system sensor histidine kinase UhpB